MPTFHYTPLHSHILPKIHLISDVDMMCEIDRLLSGKWLIYKFKHNITWPNGLRFKSYDLYLDNCCNLWKVKNSDSDWGWGVGAVAYICLEFVTLSNFHWFESNPTLYDSECNHIPLNDKLINEIVIALDNTNQIIPAGGHSSSSLKLPEKDFFDTYINRARKYAEFIDKHYKRMPFLNVDMEYDDAYWYLQNDFANYYPLGKESKIETSMYKINLDLLSNAETKSKSKFLKFVEEEIKCGNSIVVEQFFLERYDVTADFLIHKLPELLTLYNSRIPDIVFDETPDKYKQRMPRMFQRT